MILFPQDLTFSIIWKGVNKHINKRKISAHQGGSQSKRQKND